MAVPKRLRIFYFALGMILVIGVFLIVRQVRGPGRPASVTQALRTAPLAPISSRSLGHALGSDSAPVEIMEFADFECGACARFAVVEFPHVRERLIATGRLKWRFMHFPLQGHANAPAAHLAAACADEQGRVWEMMDLIFSRQDDWALGRRPQPPLRDFARSLGLDLSRYDSCVETGRGQATVDADRAEGERLHVNQTPTFVVNERRWRWGLDYDGIKAIVDSLAPVGGVRAAPERR